MDWIQKLEEEKRIEQQHQDQIQTAKVKQESDEAERFQIVKDKLCPIIKATISDLKNRTGFELQMDVGTSSLTVRAPHPRPKIHVEDGERWAEFGRITDHRFEIADVSNDGRTVRVEAISAGLTNRSRDGWEESDLSHADYFGSDETVINTRNEISTLASEDIHLLLEWVVRQELQDGDITPPELSGMRQRKEQERSAFFKAHGGLAVGIIAFFLMFAHLAFALLGPLSVYFGLHARRELKSLGITYNGHGSAKWAIGLGVIECLVLIAVIFEAVLPMRPATSIAVLEKTADSMDSKSYYDQGMKDFKEKRYDKAIENFSKAIEVDPNNNHAYMMRGATYRQKGLLDTAIEDYNKAIKLDPNDGIAYSNRGFAYSKKGQFDMAIEDFNTAITINPKRGTGYYGLARVYSLQGEGAKACNYLNKAIEKGFKNWEHLKKESDFDNIRNSDCYKRMISAREGNEVNDRYLVSLTLPCPHGC